MAADTIDQRKHRRFKVNMGAALLISDQEGRIPVRITNLSEGGVFIEGELPNSLKNETTFPIELPLQDQSVIVKVKKRWVKEGFGIGVKFHEVSSSEFALIKEFLEFLRKNK